MNRMLKHLWMPLVRQKMVKGNSILRIYLYEIHTDS